ncbi:MAG: nuclear transport factor 2 family protein [Prolixibacteraceae bacterium]|nr:nuclear transport factor 2 family protein [Prolixibacteraceae bacterium]
MKKRVNNPMNEAVREIEEIVNRETRAWDTQDVELLLSVFHPDMVWPWPPTANNHDPLEWIFVLGKYNRKKWGENWQQLFDTHYLKHNTREIKKIVVTDENDGAFAVVDIDTLWIHKESGFENHWKGRVCKVYTKMPESWKLIMHTGVLEYNDL